MQYEPYVAPNVSVDGVVFQLLDNELVVLLIRRAREPFKGSWALPGGYNPAGETTLEATARVLKDKAGVTIKQLDLVGQLYTFDSTARDPRGHALAIVYMGLGKNLVPKASSTTESPQFFPVNDLPGLAFDHDSIIKFARGKLISQLLSTNTAYALLPKFFTLSQLQATYEAILGQKLDKRNFRKKILGMDLLAETDEHHMDGAHRPARLYKFKQQKLQELSKDI